MSSVRTPPIRAIFFDFDGVLADTEPLHYQCWAQVLAPQGISFTWPHYVSEMVGLSNRQMVELLCRQAGKTYSRDFFERCYAEKKVLYQGQILDCPMPDQLLGFVREQGSRYKMAVVSSSSRCEVEPPLISRRVRQYFSALVCEEDVENHKPAPDPYLHALCVVNTGASRKIAAAECLVVEDSGPGLEAGCRAGMRVLRVPSPSEVLELVERQLAA